MCPIRLKPHVAKAGKQDRGQSEKIVHNYKCNSAAMDKGESYLLGNTSDLATSHHQTFISLVTLFCFIKQIVLLS